MLQKAWSESKCDPCAFYPGSSNCTPGFNPRTAKGFLQLLNHDDLILGACPGFYVRWQEPQCIAQAARWLYDGRGRAPWR